MATAKRRRELERARQERQAQRRAEAARRRRRTRLIAGGTAATVLVVGGGAAYALTRSSGKATAPASPPGASATATRGSANPGPSPSARPSGTPVCDFATDSRGGGKHVGLPPDRKATTDATLQLATDKGPVALRLDHGKAPCTTTALTYLAAQKYYDGTSCHRLVTSGIFVLQCGDPTGSGSGGPGFSQQEEGLAGATYPRGTVAMAKTQAPHSTGAQFFLCYKDTPLPAQYTPVGSVTTGLDIIDKVAAAGVAAGGSSPTDGAPKTPLKVTTVKVKTV